MLLPLTTNEGHFSEKDIGNPDTIPRRKELYNRRLKLNLARQSVRDNSEKTTALIRGTGPER